MTRVRALIARAVGNNPRLSDSEDRTRALELRGLGRYAMHVKSAEEATTAEDVAAALAPLTAPFIALVGQRSAIAKIPGAIAPAPRCDGPRPDGRHQRDPGVRKRAQADHASRVWRDRGRGESRGDDCLLDGDDALG